MTPAKFDSEGMPLMAYWPHVGPPSTADVEHLRQAFSGVTLVCDHLDAFSPSEPLAFVQQADLDAAYASLRAAHRRLKHLAIDLQGVTAHSGLSVGLEEK